jgi:hypothetical protein
MSAVGSDQGQQAPQAYRAITPQTTAAAALHAILSAILLHRDRCVLTDDCCLICYRRCADKATTRRATAQTTSEDRTGQSAGVRGEDGSPE